MFETDGRGKILLVVHAREKRYGCFVGVKGLRLAAKLAVNLVVQFAGHLPLLLYVLYPVHLGGREAPPLRLT